MSAKDKALRLGLTGGVACGKSTAAACLRKLGAFVVDADAISHGLTGPGGSAVEAVAQRFGQEILDEQGGINRRALGQKVFGDEKERIALEAILHPAIQREMLRQMDMADEQGAQVVVLDVPLLFECGLDVLCDQVWVVRVNQDEQVLRMFKRDRINREEALRRIASQMPLEQKAEKADRVIDTGRSEADVENELRHLYKELTRRK